MRPRCLSLAVLSIVLAACGGGGGGGSAAGDSATLSLTLAPASLEETLYTGHPVNITVAATVAGTVEGNVMVLIEDDVGVIEPTVPVTQWSETEYTATLTTAAGLGTGHYQGNLHVTICGYPGCSPVYVRKELPYDFTVLAAPAITSLAPASVLVGKGDFTLTVNGRDFQPDTVILWNGVAQATTYVSSAQLQMLVAANKVPFVGTVNVAVSQPVSGRPPVLSPEAQFLVRNPAPAITALDPAGVRPGWPGNLMVLVSGSNFVPGSAVLVDGQPVATVIVFSPELLSFSLPYTSLVEGRLVNVAVRNAFPGGGTSNTLQFAVANAVPAVTALNPAAIALGSPDTPVAVTGTGFQPNSLVQVNGTDRATEYVSDTLLVISVTTADLSTAGSLAITVTNPPFGGGTSAALNLDVTAPAPVLAALDPAMTSAGCGTTTLAVAGQDFQPSSVIRINGSARQTTFLSSQRLTATITAGELANAGSAQVTVATAGVGGGSSAARTFTIAASAPVTSGATSWQVDDRHSGTASVHCPSAMPMTATWSRAVNGVPGMMLVVNGRVFVNVRPLDAYAPAELLALDAATGSVLWGPVPIFSDIRIGYSPGRVIVAAANYFFPGNDQTVSAYDEASGALLWSQPVVAPTGRIGPPVSSDSLVFASLGGVTQAFSAATGVAGWSMTGIDSMPVVTAGAVLTSDYCTTYALDAATGAESWHAAHSCYFSNAYQVAVSDGDVVLTRNEGAGWERVAAATGVAGSMLLSDYPPALRDGMAYTVSNQQMHQVALADGASLDFTTAPVTSAPVLVNRTLLALTTGATSVVAVDVDSGGVQWTIPVAEAPRTDRANAGVTPLADAPVVGDGLLLVRGTGVITAFRIGE